MALIQHAVSHRDSRNTYATQGDYVKRVLRDSHGTSFHLNGYKTADQAIKGLTELVAQLEHIVTVFSDKQKIDFANKLRFDESVGCLEARMGPALQWALQIISSAVPQLDDIMQHCSHQFANKKLFSEKLAYVLEYCAASKYTKCIHQNKEFTITSRLIEKYMVEILCEQLDEEKYDEEKHDEYSYFYRVEAQETLNVIRDEMGLIKKLSNDHSWEYLLNQLADPEHCRPSREVRHGSWRPINGPWKNKSYEGHVKKHKPGHFLTKKTPTTLLPHDGQIQQFNNHSGILFNLAIILSQHEEHNKNPEKYIFLQNAATNSMHFTPGIKSSRKGVSFNQVVEQNRNARKKNEILSHNELVMRLSKHAVCGVFSVNDTREARIDALHKKYMVMQSLEIDDKPLDIPALIISPNHPPKIYTELEQQADINALSKNHTHVKEILSIKGKLEQSNRLSLKSFELIIKKNDRKKMDYVFSQLDNCPDDYKKSIFNILTIHNRKNDIKRFIIKFGAKIISLLEHELIYQNAGVILESVTDHNNLELISILLSQSIHKNDTKIAIKICKLMQSNPNILLSRKDVPFQRGDKVSIYDTRATKWYPSTVINVTDPMLHIHYDGYDAKFDEWINMHDASRVRQISAKKSFISGEKLWQTAMQHHNIEVACALVNACRISAQQSFTPRNREDIVKIIEYIGACNIDQFHIQYLVEIIEQATAMGHVNLTRALWLYCEEIISENTLIIAAQSGHWDLVNIAISSRAWNTDLMSILLSCAIEQQYTSFVKSRVGAFYKNITEVDYQTLMGQPQPDRLLTKLLKLYLPEKKLFERILNFHYKSRSLAVLSSTKFYIDFAYRNYNIDVISEAFIRSINDNNRALLDHTLSESKQNDNYEEHYYIIYAADKSHWECVDVYMTHRKTNDNMLLSLLSSAEKQNNTHQFFNILQKTGNMNRLAELHGVFKSNFTRRTLEVLNHHQDKFSASKLEELLLYSINHSNQLTKSFLFDFAANHIRSRLSHPIEIVTFINTLFEAEQAHQSIISKPRNPTSSALIGYRWQGKHVNATWHTLIELSQEKIKQWLQHHPNSPSTWDEHNYQLVNTFMRAQTSIWKPTMFSSNIERNIELVQRHQQAIIQV